MLLRADFASVPELDARFLGAQLTFIPWATFISVGILDVLYHLLLVIYCVQVTLVYKIYFFSSKFALAIAPRI